MHLMSGPVLQMGTQTIHAFSLLAKQKMHAEFQNAPVSLSTGAEFG